MRNKLAFLLFTLFMNSIYSCAASLNMKEEFDTGLICVMSRSSVLDMSNCNIDDNKAMFISEFLKDNKILRHIKLNSNNIGDKGITALGRMFETLPMLEEIHLSNNKFGNEGAVNLFFSLKKVWALKLLDIKKNLFNEDSLEALLGLLSVNPKLALETSLFNFKDAL